MGVAPQGEVPELLGLPGGRVGHLASAVTGLDDKEAREPVEVLLSPAVPDPRPLALHHDGHLMVGVGAHAGEVHPEVALGGGLQAGVVPVAAEERVTRGRLGCGAGGGSGVERAGGIGGGVHFRRVAVGGVVCRGDDVAFGCGGFGGGGGVAHLVPHW
jgi:hypothetical protein